MTRFKWPVFLGKAITVLIQSRGAFYCPHNQAIESLKVLLISSSCAAYQSQVDVVAVGRRWSLNIVFKDMLFI